MRFDRNQFVETLDVSRETLERLDAYEALLMQWAPRVNLVSKTTLSDVWGRHFLDSAQILYLARARDLSWVDLGSGAGFPGLVVAIMAMQTRPIRMRLIESDRRKATFLEEAIRITGVGAEVLNTRIEDLVIADCDVITARACAPIGDLLAYAERLASDNTRCIFLKGRRLDEELTEARKSWTMDVRRHVSRSDPAGAVVEIRGFGRV
jgi:16S rRNA (guanine527-N7)-methyltransferase